MRAYTRFICIFEKSAYSGGDLCVVLIYINLFSCWELCNFLKGNSYTIKWWIKYIIYMYEWVHRELNTKLYDMAYDSAGLHLIHSCK